MVEVLPGGLGNVSKRFTKGCDCLWAAEETPVSFCLPYCTAMVSCGLLGFSCTLMALR